MLVYIAFLLSLTVLTLTLLGRFSTLEVTDEPGAALILDSRNIGLFNIMTAILRGGVRVRLFRGIDTNISIPDNLYTLADTCHPPLAQRWGEMADAALSSTRAAIQHFKSCSAGPDEVIHLHQFIRWISMLTFLNVFFHLPISPTNTQEVAWIVGKSWQMRSYCQDFIEAPAELRSLLKSSPNPSGILALLSATQRLVLSAVCLLEHRRDTIGFLRQARVLLENPASSGSEVTRLVEKIIRSHPPVQSIHGALSLEWFPFRWTYDVDFIIPVDTLPQSLCLMGPDGACASWLHKAALPGQPACDGRAWLTHAAAIILSAIETEIRKAGLTIDEDENDPYAWENWVLRRLRVG